MPPNTILLRGNRPDYNQEAEADGTITPGDAVEKSGEETSGVEDHPLVQRQSTDGESGAIFLVALEQRGMAGRGIDDDYSDGDQMTLYPPRAGDKLYMWHNTAEDIAYGAKLVLSGDGTLRELNTAGGDVESDVVAEARSAVSNATGTAKTRVKAEAI